MSKFNFKLKTKLYFISIGMVLLFTAVVFVQFEKGIRDQKQGKIDSFNLYYENLSSTISQLFYAQYNNIQAFTRNRDLKDLKNVEGGNFVLNELITLYPSIDYLVLVDLNGKVVTSSTIDSEGKKLKTDFLKAIDFNTKPWYKDTLNGKYMEDFKKKIFGAYVGKVELDDVAKTMYGKDRLGMMYGTLIEDEFGDPIAVLGAYSNMRWVENEMTNLYNVLASNGMKSSEIYLLNKAGKPISFFGKSAGAKKSMIKHDFKSYNLKEDMFALKHPVIDELKKKKHGTSVATDFMNPDKEHIYAYGPIKNRRFLDAIGWKLVVGMQPSDAFSEIIALQKVFYMTLAGAFIVCCFVSIFIVTRLYSQLISVIEGLRASAGRTLEFVSQLNEMSGKVNDMSSSQASAIQETASTLDEVSQMVKMSAQNANNSVEISSKSEKSANTGKQVVAKVVEAMHGIKDSNENILTTTSEGNKKINEIVAVINEISEKTKVINDIVFQTKLLSFNASVEAARAGEHGKGFAVVAEEVGNLAQMSGKAAEEIGDILGESISRVESIVTENQSAIEKIMVTSKEKIEQGIEITGECDRALEEIVEGVKVVSNMSNEISTATREQESGVSNISMAMNQLQDSTNENSNIAFQTLKCSEQLDQETDYLREVIETLENEVVGGKAVPKKAKETTSNKQVAQKKEDNVLELPKKEVVAETVVENKKENELKSVVGAEIPDADDPRFEDI
jgi:methyl-accepting chemotaxis protein